MQNEIERNEIFRNEIFQNETKPTERKQNQNETKFDRNFPKRNEIKQKTEHIRMLLFQINMYNVYNV